MKSEKLTIALTYTGTEEKHNKYVNWLKGSDGIDIIKLSAEGNNLGQLHVADALVMSGGIDAHPKHYGSSVTNYPNAPSTFNEARDEFEIAAFHLAQKINLPLLAICRGMQLANCILGGDLTQDLGEELNKKHRNKDEEKKHDVLIEPGSLLHIITNKKNDIADSAHHQCINRLGKGLMVNATSHDGIIEGVEWADKKDKAFFLGVQWHPERMYMQQIENSSLSKNIREYFLNEARRYKEAVV